MRYAIAGVLLLVAGTVIFLLGFTGDKPGAGKPTTALILVYDDRGKLAGLHRLSDAKQVGALEAFFPGYQGRPSSRTAGGWKYGYQVYFDAADGHSARVAVSPPSIDLHVWSMGHGDLAVAGDFHKFVAELGAPVTVGPESP